MTASTYDSALFRDLLHDTDTARLLSDGAAVRAMLLVEGALARVQGARGIIPETAAAAIQRASHEVIIDPAGLAADTGRRGVPVPALVAAFRKAMEAPEHARFIHWGATCQDIMDTALVLRLRQMLALWERRLIDLLGALGDQAQSHAETPMAGRIRGQIAGPTSFGATVAGWGAPLLRDLDRLAQMRPRLLCVSLSGTVRTAAAPGDDPDGLRADFAAALGLGDPGESWHSNRDRIAELAAWIASVTGNLGKMGRDLSLMTQSERAEVRLGDTATDPPNQPPVQPELLVALATQTAGLNGMMQGALVHAQQGDSASMFTEWLTLPQLCAAIGRASALAPALVAGLTADTARMAALIDDGTGLIWAETLTHALADRIPHPEAQDAVTRLCAEAQTARAPLPDLMARDFPGTDWHALCGPPAHLGRAPAQARAFAARTRALTP